MYFILYFISTVPTCLSKQNRLISGKPPSQATASARPAHLVTLVQGGSYHSEKMRKAGSRQEKGPPGVANTHNLCAPSIDRADCRQRSGEVVGGSVNSNQPAEDPDNHGIF